MSVSMLMREFHVTPDTILSIVTVGGKKLYAMEKVYIANMTKSFVVPVGCCEFILDDKCFDHQEWRLISHTVKTPILFGSLHENDMLPGSIMIGTDISYEDGKVSLANMATARKAFDELMGTDTSFNLRVTRWVSNSLIDLTNPFALKTLGD